jgi:hypothetical protein
MGSDEKDEQPVPTRDADHWTLAGGVVGYWVGSSAGSASKDVALKQMAVGR